MLIIGKMFICIFLIIKWNTAISQELKRFNFHNLGIDSINLSNRIGVNVKATPLKDSYLKNHFEAYPASKFFLLFDKIQINISYSLFFTEAVVASVDDDGLINNLFLYISDSSGLLGKSISELGYKNQWGIIKKEELPYPQHISWTTDIGTTVVLSIYNKTENNCRIFNNVLQIFRSADSAAVGNNYIIYKCK